MLRVGKNFYFQGEDNDRIIAVAKALAGIGRRMIEVAEAHKCPMSDMLGLEIGLMMQRLEIASLYRNANPDEVPWKCSRV